MSKSLSSLTVLITGGAGYIGSHVVKHLCNAGSKVIILDNLSLGNRSNIDSRAIFIEGDILNANDIKEAFSHNIDAVIHLAAWKAAGESMIQPDRYAINNINGSNNVLRAMVEYEIPYIIFSSSAAVYGFPEYLPIDENHPVKPTNYYGFTKLVIEQNIEWFARLKNIKFANLRYFNAAGFDAEGTIRGKERCPANLLPIVMEVASGIRNTVQVYGNDYDTPDGTGIRDYIHVDDLVDAHLKSLEYISSSQQNLTLNLGTGKRYSVLEVIRLAEKITGKAVAYEIVDRRSGDCRELYTSCHKAEELIQWRAQFIKLDDIIRTMYPVYFE
jgi:UDP-glucose 4-epimerase